ncbi:MAG TPA: methyltransferase domain-containing protein [Candidatus Saccharimonadia bacterium]|nr:methyltransferase domain-containing protein [Candidatus Saccharimonadia bacterium]
MDKSLLVKIAGFTATLIHGDTLVMDRWRWLKKRLPDTRNNETLLDVGCGTGSFTIGAARRGYHALGLSWDERNQTVARERAELCKSPESTFEILDVRELDKRRDLVGRFDVVVCMENIEHILDDRKLMVDMAECLRPGGRLLLSTPYFHNIAITKDDRGPYPKVEDGWHMRRGYTWTMLDELCTHAGLKVERFSSCGGFLSQMITRLMRMLSRVHPVLGWGTVLPLRILPPLLDWLLDPLTGYPHQCICLEAYKPRYGNVAAESTAPASAQV